MIASEAKLSSWTVAVCYFINLVQPSIECEDYRQAFDHENHSTLYIACNDSSCLVHDSLSILSLYLCMWMIEG